MTTITFDKSHRKGKPFRFKSTVCPNKFWLGYRGAVRRFKVPKLSCHKPTISSLSLCSVFIISLAGKD